MTVYSVQIHASWDGIASYHLFSTKKRAEEFILDLPDWKKQFPYFINITEVEVDGHSQ